MTLTIISHTEHYRTANGIVGLSPTVTEINHLLEVFDSITHVAMLHSTEAPENTKPYNSEKIKFVALPQLGGTKTMDKIKLLSSAPNVLKIVGEEISKTDYFQFRAPTGIGVYVLPYLILRSKFKGWFKYAGSWSQSNIAWSYRWQRWLLKQQARKVTINGSFKNQPMHCLSFFNPCLTDDEIIIGHSVRTNKSINNKMLNFCYVGRLEDEKGFNLVVEALKMLSKDERAKIQNFEVVGEGQNKQLYQKEMEAMVKNVEFRGLLSRKQVHKVYVKSDIILLPSKSEGFPKVITEAMNYGCIPIVSDIPSLKNFIIHKKNGYIVSPLDAHRLAAVFKQLFELSPHVITEFIKDEGLSFDKFSYSHYNKRIDNEVLN